MQIFILSAGRAGGKHQTLHAIPGLLLGRTRLVVQAAEVKAYAPIAERFGVDMLVLPKKITTISPTRQHLLNKVEDRNFVMLDDDLTFARRHPLEPGRYVAAAPADIRGMFTWLDRETSGRHAHAGIASREGANRVTTDVVFNTRMVRILAYDTIKLRDACVRFDRIPLKQDFDMTLQLLRLGYANVVNYEWCHNQPGSNVAGGCSTFRTPELCDTTSRELARLHPGLVKVVQKETKTSWGGGVRTDVVISWKKAYEESKK